MADRFDVIVIGGGHAGAEAAMLSSRMGARTLLLTQQLETIGQMSCNPAIGGIAKGTVVREVDALGGVMGKATDLARVQFRMLNRSKGPAVWSPRAQCDRGLYRKAVRSILEHTEGLSLAQATVVGFFRSGRRITGVATADGERFMAKSVVLTAGTFLRGRIHLGLEMQIAAGRAGEAPAIEVAEALAEIGLRSERFKTGTPPRIDGRSVDLSRLERQDGDPGEFWFSFYDRAPHPPQLPCYLTYSGHALVEIVRRHLGSSALYGGAISGRGPRYCPSIEDKVVRFPDAPRHQVFLEPEGLDTSEMYVNGLSTSLPPRVQFAFLRTLPGLDDVAMTRPGYAIEYDYYPPTQLRPTMEVREVPGLFLAGQVNGTTGYEEAAGQGALAGLNAAASALERDPTVLPRESSFIGVLVDDLVHRGVDEPYRLFTSRSEFRLLHRQDNALRRMLPLAQRLRLLSSSEEAAAEHRLRREEQVLEAAMTQSLGADQANGLMDSWGLPPVSETMRVAELARRPGTCVVELLTSAGVEVDQEAAEWADIELKYEGYLAKERAAARRLSQLSEFELPEQLEYSSLSTISFEAREKLSAIRPSSLAQARAIPGVSPSDLQALVMEVAKLRRA